MATAPLLFINAGWQIRYQGPAADDPTLGGHGHLRTHSMGHEAWNFQPYKGRLYGYIPREAVVRIGNLGATSSDDHAAGVTVVWLARHPSTGRTVIVGWYRNATVHRRADAHVLARKGGYSVKYQIDAPADQAKLLSLDQRTFEIPTKKEKGCLGQSPVWYGASDAFRARVRAFIDRDGRHEPPAKKSVKGGAPRSNDPEARKRIELAAVAYATRYYKSIEGGERTVESVERDAVGWDLNAIGPADTLKVEVKGLTGTEPVVELTPNEYEAMRSPEHRNHYVIFIVTEASTPSERAHIFRYDAEASTKKRAVWVSHSGRELQIEERTGARLRG
jgi:hypothetical protein